MDNRTFLPPKILLMRKHFYDTGDWTPEASAYVKEHKLDLDEINAHTGLFAVCLCQHTGISNVTGLPTFDFFPDGVPAAVIEVLAEDAVTVIDLAAWPLHAPEFFATAVGEADMLGISNMRSTRGCKFSGPLKVFRTPHNWLKAGCQGCVVLNPRYGGYWLRRTNREILAEDLAHGRELRAILKQEFKFEREFLRPQITAAFTSSLSGRARPGYFFASSPIAEITAFRRSLFFLRRSFVFS